jgi:hypothetical protein
MNTVLYIVSKSAHNWQEYKFILTPRDDDGHQTVVFLENGVIDEGLSAEKVFRLRENKETSIDKNTESSPFISYRELLDLIFASDHSVVV